MIINVLVVDADGVQRLEPREVPDDWFSLPAPAAGAADNTENV